MIIEDGTGHGYRLKIDQENRIYSKNDSMPYVGHMSQIHQEAYMVICPIVTVSGYGGKILSLKNVRSGYYYIISRFLGFWNGGDTNHDRCAYVTLYMGDSAPTANYVSSVAGNMHFGSGNVAEMDVRYWDGVGAGMTQTGGTPGGQVIVNQGYNDMDVNNALVIPYNGGLSIGVTPEETGKVSVIISGYFADTKYL